MWCLFCWPVFAALTQAAATPPPGALHAIIRSEFQYVSTTRTTDTEYWISAGQILRKRDKQLTPVPEPSFAKPAPQPEDLHTAGYTYEPEFTWQLTDTAETRVLNGRECRLTTATGIAEFAQTDLRLWFCPSQSGDERKVSSLVAQMAGRPYPAVARYVAGELERRTGSVLLQLEETADTPIAPLIVWKIQAELLGTAQPAQ